MGTLCLSLRATCNDASSEVASTTVANADMWGPIDGPPGWNSPPVPYSIPNVPDGTWQLFALLDKDGSGCDTITTGDLHDSAGCVQVVVSGGNDVTDVELEFNNNAP
jgi:hypothetical protein